MELSACGHLAHEGRFRTCLHLSTEEHLSVVRLSTGHRGDYHLLCRACAELDDPWSQLAAVCAGCADRTDEAHVSRISGQPEIRHLDRPVTGAFHEERLPAEPANDGCLVALGHGWLVYTGRHVVLPDGTSYELVLPEDEQDDNSNDCVVAIQGIGLAEEPIVEGVQLWCLTSGRPLTTPGPGPSPPSRTACCGPTG